MSSQTPTALTRKELARFLPDKRSIEAFEALFRLIPSELNNNESLIADLQIDSSMNTAALSAILAHMGDANSLHNSSQLAALSPRIEPFIDTNSLILAGSYGNYGS